MLIPWVCGLHCPVEVALACKDLVSKVCLLPGTAWEEGAACDAINIGFDAAVKQIEFRYLFLKPSFIGVVTMQIGIGTYS